jgi:type IV pilus assembly protein PilO
MNIKALFANTPKRQVYLLTGLVGLALVAGWWFYVMQPARQQRDSMRGQVARLQQDLFQKQRISEELPKLEAAREELQKELEKALRRLPEEKEIPNLLTQINRLGQEAGLAFSLFKPGKPVKDEFYTRIPIRIRADGTYHALGRFFEHLSRMERIVNITDLKLDQADTRRPVSLGTDRATITGEFTATTFTFRGTEGQPEEAAKPGAKPGAPGSRGGAQG